MKWISKEGVINQAYATGEDLTKKEQLSFQVRGEVYYPDHGERVLHEESNLCKGIKAVRNH